MVTEVPVDTLSSSTCDLVVIGGGAAGLTAALTAALHGLDVVLLEKAAQLGGTSAFSSGTVWIPDNPYYREAGVTDDREKAEAYLDQLVGDLAPRELRKAFLNAGPEMIRFLGETAGVRFRPYATAPDYRQDIPGAAMGGRPLEPLPFDARQLGKHFSRVRSPIPELMLFGGMMITRGEAATLLRGVNRASVALACTLGIRYLADRLRHHRGTRLVLGNALVAHLFKALLDRQVKVLFDVQVESLLSAGGRVEGVQFRHDGQTRQLRASRGVVLAAGGFPANAEMRQKFLPDPTPSYTPACPDCTGDMLQLAQQTLGAALGAPTPDNALWFPSSVANRADGSQAVYPHIVLDRAKPGLLAVNRHGRRFVNEAVSYHEFVRGMYRAEREDAGIPAYLVCDAAFLWKYGLGMILPRTLRVQSYVDKGYLFRGASVAGLAQSIGVDSGMLEATVQRYNGFAHTGVDEDFHKGETVYERSNGDASHGPNPCIGPIGKAPFYAVRVWPTPLGTSLGLATDVHARVLDHSDNPIPGLYSCGNDMNSIFGGQYPGAGAQLGPAMTFGYLAARHAALTSSVDLG